MTFINQIIMHLGKNGTIEAGMLFESPFTNVNDQGLPGVFDEAASTRIIQLIERINWNAMVGGVEGDTIGFQNLAIIPAAF
jgi:type I restriction enzyme R subunit